MPDPDGSMITLIGAVFIATLLGSPHCAGMCGALVLFAVGADGKPVRRWPAHLGYHLGRGIGYTLLGVAAGGLGRVLDIGADDAMQWERPAAFVAGGLLALFGLVALARGVGLRVSVPRLPRGYQKLVEHGHRLAFALGPVKRAWAVGLLSPLLPCGFLYLFAVAAAGTGSFVWGGLTMLVFWSGTLPVMVSVGAGLQFLTGPLRDRLCTLGVAGLGRVGVRLDADRLRERVLPALTSVLIVAAGLWIPLRVIMNSTVIDPSQLATAGATTPAAIVEALGEADPDEACPLCNTADKNHEPPAGTAGEEH